MSIATQIFRNIASNWMLLVLNVGITFLLSPFIVNTLGSLYYGLWALTMQFTGYLYVLDFGVRDSVIRYTAHYRGLGHASKLNHLLSTSLVVYAPLAALSLLATGIGIVGFQYWFTIEPAYVDESKVALACVGITIALGFLFNTFGGVLIGLQRYDLSNLVGAIGAPLRAALIVWVLSDGHGIVGLALIQLGLSILSYVATVWLAIRELTIVGLPFRLQLPGRRRAVVIARRIIGYSTYVFLNNMGQKLVMGADAIVIGVFLPVSSVTYYAIAANLISLLRGAVVSAVWALMPLVSHYAARRQMSEVRVLWIRGSKGALFLALPVCAGYVLVGHEFIALWMGAEFATLAAQVLAILAVAELVSAPHHAAAAVLYGLGRHRSLAYLRVVEGVVNLSLSIWLVQWVGLRGVALGTAVPHVIVVLIILPLLLCRTLGVPGLEYFKSAYLRPVVCAIPAVVLLVAVKTWWPTDRLALFLGQMGMVVVPYMLLGVRFVLTRDERNALRRGLGYGFVPPE